ncbi:N-acetylmuramoyl-L-alanine amidase [Falsiroseomonas tokyonensis]|uniref:N-acetylmuramoyl-L-alanine amidase n=1 Tax=Falsiroseomonas tokyonensis TaxID=430521 RepID=A0ABV7BUC5_9PROT|nr:N-acetylmuramoyl-L-alanine amidase [Falsiroseomonas tokyonensis]MBU8539110.1 N-acetylmuramoyl-L-alanine amidase [Falsiroseomonas tokyonensis]
MRIENHRLAEAPFDATPHCGGPITPRFLVMHYTAGGSALNSVRAIRDRGLSAHFFVDRDGAVIQTVPCDRLAYHAGPSYWRGHDGLNTCSIGIEIANLGWFDRREAGGWTRSGLARPLPEGEVVVAAHKNGGPSMGWEAYPEAQLKAVAALTEAIRAAYPSIQEVVGHDDIAPRRKQDPGPAFPLARFQHLGGAAGSGTLAENDLGQFEVSARDNLNLRGGPGTGFAVLGKLAPGSRLRVLREEGDWRLVDLQGDAVPDGFVHGAFLRRLGG